MQGSGRRVRLTQELAAGTRLIIAPIRLELPARNYSLKPIVDGLAGEQ
jgi:hypothetical protein